METFENATDLLDTTIETLGQEENPQADSESSNLLSQWIEVLKQSENTRPLSNKLAQLSSALTTDSPNMTTIEGLLNDIADATQEFAVEVGPEGELPSQLEGLAAALRNLTIQHP
ncbi:hypothetical protein GCM10027299_12430 [Larkinella ripae]